MWIKSILLFCIFAKLSNGKDVVYDRYTSKPATNKQLEYYKSVNQLGNCTVKVSLPCSEDEWRRVDGSCNNLKYPARNTFMMPLYRVLPADFSEGNEPRKAHSGKALKSVRLLRISVLPTGKSVHLHFTLNLPGYGIFMYGDINSTHDIENYIIHNRKCCEKKHMKDHVCIPNILEDDDPVHRFDDIRCLNATRPVYYQTYNCTKDPIPAPIAQATPSYDLSHIYNQYNEGDKPMRSFKKGQLLVEVENGRIWPPNGPLDQCIANYPDEKRCMRFHRNALLPIQLFNIWFVRLHNDIAKNLARVNPCWSDETLFQQARDINIAFSQQMFLYEWMGSLIDNEVLIKYGILNNNDGHRDMYDKSKYPRTSVEFSFALRWFHIIQETIGNLFNLKGQVVMKYPINNCTFRTGCLTKENYMEGFTQGCFRQPTRAYDHGVDYDMAERGLGGIQRALDTFSNDLNKNRYMGLPRYIYYIKHFRGIEITCFDDLVKYNIISEQNVALLKDTIDHVDDIDLMLGMWLEEKMENSEIPHTLAHILMDNVLTGLTSDRHQYERPNRPHAFTKAQLKEIRKAKLSLMLCTVGDGVTEVQPNAFKVISHENPLTPCSKIPQINYNAWADPKCKSN